MSQFGNFESLCDTLEFRLARPKNNKISEDAIMVFESFCTMKGLYHFGDAFEDKDSEWFLGDTHPKLYEELLDYRIRTGR